MESLVSSCMLHMSLEPAPDSLAWKARESPSSSVHNRSGGAKWGRRVSGRSCAVARWRGEQACAIKKLLRCVQSAAVARSPLQCAVPREAEFGDWGSLRRLRVHGSQLAISAVACAE